MASTPGSAGRRRELVAVVAVLTGASDAPIMLVVGEAGVGKSRLIAAAGAAAARADVGVLLGGCAQLSSRLPFIPVVDVLRSAGEADDGRLAEDVSAQCPAFVRGEMPGSHQVH